MRFFVPRTGGEIWDGQNLEAVEAVAQQADPNLSARRNPEKDEELQLLDASDSVQFTMQLGDGWLVGYGVKTASELDEWAEL
jgi:hypothetical protein